MSYKCSIPTENQKQWKAGEDNGKPFYYDCAGCGKHEPVIAGFLNSQNPPTFLGMIALEDGVFFKMAVYCKSCWEQVTA